MMCFFMDEMYLGTVIANVINNLNERGKALRKCVSRSMRHHPLGRNSTDNPMAAAIR